MSRLIDADNIDFSYSSKELYPFLHYVLDLFDAQPTIKAYTKDEVIAMFIELQNEIEKIEMDNNVPFGFKPVNKFYEGVSASSRVVQQKINKLKGEEE